MPSPLHKGEDLLRRALFLAETMFVPTDAISNTGVLWKDSKYECTRRFKRSFRHACDDERSCIQQAFD